MESNIQENTSQVFAHGSVWIKADFHLHTKEDKEFSYAGDESHYVASYVKGLKQAAIGVGVIANHNKFSLSEFKKLRKEAKKEGIFLMPGLELSVKDGSSGVHTIVVFSDDWIVNRENTDYITNFLNLTFSGQSHFENRNARSNHDISGTINELNKYAKDYFLVFAHVEADNGLWGSLSGGRLTELGKEKIFTEKVLAFQKVRTFDETTKVKKWFDGWYPAEVEGSDCKSISGMNIDKSCFLKIGDFKFEAIKYALRDFQNRVSQGPVSYSHSHINSIRFEGGLLGGACIRFSPELNSLIGIRGSGKSAILEAIRYVLDIPHGEKASDVDYKKELIQYTLGSGGKAVVSAMDSHGRLYEITRILDKYPEVLVEGDHQPGIKIRETILRKPIYFGQKDLSSTGEGFEKDLVEKLVGDKLVGIRGRISEQANRVVESIDHLQKLEKAEDLKIEFETKKQDAEYQLKIFKEHHIEEKLEKRINFDKDTRKVKQVIDFSFGYITELTEFISRFEDDFANLPKYSSNQNEGFFKEFLSTFGKVIVSFDSVKQSLTGAHSAFDQLKNSAKEFDVLKKGLVEEFAEIERKLSDELREKGASSIRPDEFITLRKAVDHAKQMLNILDKQHAQKTSLSNELLKELVVLNELWHQEFQMIQEELIKINGTASALTIESDFKGDKETFKTFMIDMFKGSRIRETTFSTLINGYTDFVAIYKDFENVRSHLSSLPDVFESYFFENLKSLLIYQVPNRFWIKYRDKELKHHSLGQRASALILFVLSQRENDVIIIDQPEDDLDNQTIYEDVIKLIRQMKSGIQFIFATHNANFPVLGDAEQIHSCKFSDEKIELKNGSIDNPILQTEIVDIMEGGEEAFNKRKEIYQIWNPQNS